MDQPAACKRYPDESRSSKLWKTIQGMDAPKVSLLIIATWACVFGHTLALLLGIACSCLIWRLQLSEKEASDPDCTGTAGTRAGGVFDNGKERKRRNRGKEKPSIQSKIAKKILLSERHKLERSRFSTFAGFCILLCKNNRNVYSCFHLIVDYCVDCDVGAALIFNNPLLVDGSHSSQGTCTSISVYSQASCAFDINHVDQDTKGKQEPLISIEDLRRLHLDAVCPCIKNSTSITYQGHHGFGLVLQTEVVKRFSLSKALALLADKVATKRLEKKFGPGGLCARVVRWLARVTSELVQLDAAGDESHSLKAQRTMLTNHRDLLLKQQSTLLQIQGDVLNMGQHLPQGFVQQCWTATPSFLPFLEPFSSQFYLSPQDVPRTEPFVVRLIACAFLGVGVALMPPSLKKHQFPSVLRNNPRFKMMLLQAIGNQALFLSALGLDSDSLASPLHVLDLQKQN